MVGLAKMDRIDAMISLVAMFGLEAMISLGASYDNPSIPDQH